MSLFSAIKTFSSKWANYVGDKDAEDAIRRHLNKNGYSGKTARIEKYKLVAVQRPGWVQIYRFEVQAESVNSGEDELESLRETSHLFGLTKDDGRAKTVVRLFDNQLDQKSLFHEWAEGMLVLRNQGF